MSKTQLIQFNAAIVENQTYLKPWQSNTPPAAPKSQLLGLDQLLEIVPDYQYVYNLNESNLKSFTVKN